MGERLKRGRPLVLRGVFAVLVLATLGGMPGAERPPSTLEPLPQPMGLRLRRGVNLGNALEAPVEGGWGVTLREEYFALIRAAGFDHVRVPIRWSAHALRDPPYTIREDFFRRIDWVLERALAQGLAVIINVHHYDELVADPQGHWARFLGLWGQIAERYAGQPPEVLFELLNEPHGQLTAPVWDRLLEEALRVVRRTNPERWVVVGPVSWNHVRALPTLSLPPDDRRLLVTFHYYEPFPFTHQGAEWVAGSVVWLGTTWVGTEEERRAIERDFELAVRWALAQGRPLYLGEFGAYRRADPESRVRWTAFVARQAEAYGIPWAYWEFAAGFGIYDPVLRTWREPLLHALIPGD